LAVIAVIMPVAMFIAGWLFIRHEEDNPNRKYWN